MHSIVSDWPIRDKHGDKSITLVSSSDKLVSRDFDDKFQNSLKSMMDRRKVKVFWIRIGLRDSQISRKKTWVISTYGNRATAI